MNVQLCPNKIVGVDVPITDMKLPLFGSYKLNGIRCYVSKGELYSRSNKPIPNVRFKEYFNEILEFTKNNDIVFDGEIYSHQITFQEIVSIVMTEDKEIPESIKFNCFDCILDNDFNMKFEYRNDTLSKFNFKNYKPVVQVEILSHKEIEELYQKALDNNYEGLILRNLESPYKQGRATVKEGIIYKMKQFDNFDGIITGIEERMRNTSESFINELGKKQKHDYKDCKEHTGLANAFIVETEEFGEQKVNIAATDVEKKAFWSMREDMIGRWIVFKATKTGMKDKLLLPIFLHLRDSK